jgi:hypothetical protein
MEGCDKFSDMASWRGFGRVRSGSIAQRLSSELEPVDEDRVARAALQERKGGRFQKVAKAGEVVIRTSEQRAKAALAANEKKFQEYIEKTKRELAADTEQWKQCSAVHTSRISELEKEVRSLRRKNLNLRASGGALPTSYRKPRELHGGSSVNTHHKYQNELEGFLIARFANKEARQQALFQHYRAYPEDYSLVTRRDISLQEFEELCRQNPTWLHPVQRDVVQKIEDFWTTSKCLSIQIHCKVGYGGKWQDLVNITRKTFNTSTGKWKLNELYEGSKIYLPSFKSKWAVNEFRAEIHGEIPIMQDKSGTAAWFELPKLVEESIRDERREGYLQERRKKHEDEYGCIGGGTQLSTLEGSRQREWGIGCQMRQRWCKMTRASPIV